MNFFSLTLEKLKLELSKFNEPAFRAEQMFKWVYEKKNYDILEMSNLSKNNRVLLSNHFTFNFLEEVKVQRSKDGTIKALLELEDKNKIECIIMPYSFGNTLCISTQVGCNMGCKFCASGLLKKKRNLEVSEMVAQVLWANSVLKESKISNVVVMGTGEPFDNYDNLIDFISIINSDFGLMLGARHITVSTVGIVDKIKEFSTRNKQINLAVSLHSPYDEERVKIMESARIYKIKDILKALDDHYALTGRKVTIEYLLIDGINDRDNDLLGMIELFKYRKNFLINLIPYNSFAENDFKRSKRVDYWYNKLKSKKMNVTVRKEFGYDISGACGLLRAQVEGDI